MILVLLFTDQLYNLNQMA